MFDAFSGDDRVSYYFQGPEDAAGRANPVSRTIVGVPVPMQ